MIPGLKFMSRLFCWSCLKMYCPGLVNKSRAGQGQCKLQSQKSRIWETKHRSTNADSSTNTNKNPASRAKFLPKKLTFFARRFYTLYEQKFYNLRPLLSNTFPQGLRIIKKFGYWTTGRGEQKKRLNKVNK